MSILLPIVAALSNNDKHQFIEMEVADQWRREWAGTAEYGKVTEGGVTRRVARAMEVLHASGPGARVRIMRAAYHSTAGPGAPAESFMLHSSRRVISSGFNFIESPSLPTKPLEISSTPLELTNDSNGETENYKVTEPDDLEISEPSKWRASTRGTNSIRMPSEESSSTDNASIIDLDSKSNRNLHRKYSYDSESSDVQFRSRSNSRTSQLIDAPTTLSTLKYKSLLNNSNEWNTRRKSYSFEDTSPLNESILHCNDTLAMESSTDSGICKSTEVMNDHVDDNSHVKYFGKDERINNSKEETFREWLSKNRQNSHHRATKFKSYREHEIVMEDPKENNIALKSPGKVSITLPITIEADNDNLGKTQIAEEVERKVKRVEFCKTEVHFAAESGKVNIIATDEKPPPTNDFRKRRSAFVPMQDMIERPITLFGEKPDFTLSNGIGMSLNHNNIDIGDSDENTAATKSILKNKIPKPKPYLLGENMDFGISSEVSNKSTSRSVLTAVSLVNQQLESEKRYKSKINSTFSREAERNVINKNMFRTINTGPDKIGSLNHENRVVTNIKIEKAKEEAVEQVKNKLNSLHVSTAQAKPKTRQLRQSDLTYFGVESDRKTTYKDQLMPTENNFTGDNGEDIFQSVRLIQQVSNSVSNSVCNSDLESEEAPEYQNVPLNLNYAPIPAPRSRSKYDDIPNEINHVRALLKPIAEKETEEMKYSQKLSTRRTKVRRFEEVKTNRSLSEPPKNFRRNSMENPHRREKEVLSKYQTKKEGTKKDLKKLSINDRISSREEDPIYVNLSIDAEESIPEVEMTSIVQAAPRQKDAHKTNINKQKGDRILETPTTDYSPRHKIKEHRSDSGTDNSQRRKYTLSKDTVSSSLKRETISPRPEKSKPHYNSGSRKKVHEEVISTDPKYSQKNRENKCKTEQMNATEKKEHKSRSTQRSPKSTSDESRDHSLKNRDLSSHRKRNSSKDQTNSMRENIKPTSRTDSDSSPRRSSAQVKSNDRERDFGSKPSQNKVNKHREYVINYDDKNGIVSSICKIKPGIGPPRRKKTSKEVLKESHKNNALKNKTVDKTALRK